MTVFSTPVQQAIFTALSGNISATVYDDAPDLPEGMPADSFPYVVLGEDIANPFDTDDTLGADVLATLHVWSRYDGRKEAKAILAEIYDELHRDTLPAQAGFAFIDCLQEFASVFPPEADGRTRHAMCRYRVTVQKE